MKKFLALLLALVMALSLVACGKKDDDSSRTTTAPTRWPAAWPWSCPAW